MSDRSIIFSPPMVKALIEGKKTQTRRLATNTNIRRVAVGDRLWVRENFRLEIGFDGMAPNVLLSTTFKQMPVWHEADFGAPDPKRSKSAWGHPWGRLRPSIHMPRWASRITLLVTDVRLQRLADISESDARAEGVLKRGAPGLAERQTSRAAFMDLWDALNRAPETAARANPEVIALTFSVSERNIDQEQIRRRGAA